MEFVDATYEMLYCKVRDGCFLDEKVVIWAIDMLDAGFDSEHLRILAGTEKPYSHFYLNEIFQKALVELNIPFLDKEKVIDDYMYFLVKKAISDKDAIIPALKFSKISTLQAVTTENICLTFIFCIGQKLIFSMIHFNIIGQKRTGKILMK